MPQRFVYSPKAYVFTKNSTGEVLNVTDYVTSGQCQRLLNQASNATVVLRNPNRQFTKPTQPAFHPMDGITIFLERLKGYPVQVFTGYLDDTPYYQMYPGTVTLQATCTLKRLMYTYFDPALPYVNAFFSKYGWINRQDGTLFQGDAQANTKTAGKDGTPNNLLDGSIGKLLYATLTEIGEWDDTNIWIEQLPQGSDGLAARMSKIASTLAADEAKIDPDYTGFLNSIIGGSSQGSGGGPGGGGASPGPGGGGGGSYGNAPATPPGGYTTATFASALLGMLNIPQTNTNMQAIVGWENAEGGNFNNTATYNPLDTSLTLPGSHVMSGGSSANIQAYTSWAQGLTATAQTLSVGNYGYPAIVAALKSGSLSQIADAISNSQWGTKNPALINDMNSAPSNLGNVTVPGVAAKNSPSLASRPGHHGSGTDFKTHLAGGTINLTAAISGGNSPRGTTTPTTNTASNTPTGNLTIGGTPLTAAQRAVVAIILQVAKQLNANTVATQAAIYAAMGESTLSATDTFQNSTGQDTATEAKGFFRGGDGFGNGGAIALSKHSSDVVGIANAVENNKAFENAGGNSSSGIIPGVDSYGGHLGGTASALKEAQVIVAAGGGGSAGGSAPGGAGGGAATGGGSTGTVGSVNGAEAFTAAVAYPSVAEVQTAVLLGSAHKGLMHDQQLLPFIQQLTQASMREFQSLPNGDFFGFYPDYFGEFNQHDPYWDIHDIEILTGDIYLNDQSLVTHQYVVGDITYPIDQSLNNMLLAGVVTIFNAFNDLNIIDPGSTLSPSQTARAIKIAKDLGTFTHAGGMGDVMSVPESELFIQRYGARPQVSNYPQVRSTLFEVFLAYQQFMLAWSTQFRTTFSFTFMPEVYPGGKLAFPEHGIQMYIESVTHTWDYEEGFTTDAVLMAPAKIKGSNNPDIPPDMVQALVKPVRDAAAAQSNSPQAFVDRFNDKHGL